MSIMNRTANKECLELCSLREARDEAFRLLQIRDSLAFMPCSGLVATRAPMVGLAFNWLQLLEHVAKTSNVEPLDAPMMNWFFSMLLQR